MPNHSKNIYYTSNAFQTKYPTNSRSSFMNQIDNQEFHYIDKNNVKIGLKEITFQNCYNTFKTKYGNPNMIIIQDNYGQKVTPLYDKIHQGPESPTVDIRSGRDYYVLSDHTPPYGISNLYIMITVTEIRHWKN